MPNLVEVDDPLLVYTRVLPCIEIPMGIRAAGQRARQNTHSIHGAQDNKYMCTDGHVSALDTPLWIAATLPLT